MLLVCTDGFWSPLADADIVQALCSGEALTPALEALAQLAVRRGGATSDNTTAAVLRLK
jgi:serine/threonine protein phosphatase PrpC